MQSDSARLSFTQNQILPSELYRGIWSIALTSFGNQYSQVQRLHTKFVRQYKWLSQTQFTQIVSLCWALPGPPVIQIIITLGTLKTKSLLAGFMSFVIFNIPSWIVLFVLGWISQKYIENSQTHFPTQLKLTFLGFNAASAGVLVRGFVQNLRQHYQKPEKLFVMLASSIIFLIFRSTNSINFCLVLGAIISLYIQTQTKKKMSPKSIVLLKQSKFSCIFGRNSLILLISIYLFLWIYFSILSSSHREFIYIYIDYFVGMFIIGPLSTLFAYFYASFLEKNLMTQSQFWLGVPLAFMFPGSIINVGIYFGAVIDGARGALLSAIFIYTPCFLALYGILPQWKYYRDKPGIQRLIIGLTCVTNGFGLATIVMALQYCMKIDLSTTICVFIVSVFLNYVWGFYSVITIIIGGILANTRRWGLIYYRMLPDHEY